MVLNKALIIAEAGVNHNGDIEVVKLIKAAADAGADVVKFELWCKVSYGVNTAKAPYKRRQRVIKKHSTKC